MSETNKKTVLIVDDEEVNLQLLSNILRAQGYGTETASTGVEAFQAIQKNCPDMVLLDIEMPEMDGLTLLKKVRETHGPQKLPVVMITIKDSSEDIVQALDSGANDYVTKPIDLSVLLARIRAHLGVSKEGKS